MSKKKFTEGLESLFGMDTYQESLPKESPLLVETEVNTKEKAKSTKRKRTSKNFTSDLDTLFEEALHEPFVNKNTKTETNSIDTANKPTQKLKAVSGLDALIRQTQYGAESEITYERRKRVTFVFEKQKIETLKRIAKKRKIYLKDLLGELVEDFISQNELS